MTKKSALTIVALLLAVILPFASLAEDTDKNKNESFEEIFRHVTQQAPSERFATGAVFDISRQYHTEFEEAVRSGDALSLLK